MRIKSNLSVSRTAQQSGTLLLFGYYLELDFSDSLSASEFRLNPIITDTTLLFAAGSYRHPLCPRPCPTSVHAYMYFYLRRMRMRSDERAGRLANPLGRMCTRLAMQRKYFALHHQHVDLRFSLDLPQSESICSSGMLARVLSSALRRMNIGK